MRRDDRDANMLMSRQSIQRMIVDIMPLFDISLMIDCSYQPGNNRTADEY